MKGVGGDKWSLTLILFLKGVKHSLDREIDKKTFLDLWAAADKKYEEDVGTTGKGVEFVKQLNKCREINNLFKKLE